MLCNQKYKKLDNCMPIDLSWNAHPLHAEECTSLSQKDAQTVMELEKKLRLLLDERLENLQTLYICRCSAKRSSDCSDNYSADHTTLMLSFDPQVLFYENLR